MCGWLFTPTSNRSCIAFLALRFNFASKDLIFRTHNEPILLGIFDTVYVFDLPVYILYSIPRIVPTLSFNCEIKYSRATTDDVLNSIKSGRL